MFISIAIEESDIERLRQGLAQIREFSPKVLFDAINKNGDEHITAEEFLVFMKNNYVKDATLDQC